MPRKQKVPLKALQDPLQYPIRKSKTFSRNLCSFIRMLDKHFSSLPSKNYLRLVHKYVLKCRTRFKKEHQTGYISVRQQIKICKACDGWTGRRPMVHCLQCQDIYHIVCANNVEDPKEWLCSTCAELEKEYSNGAKIDHNEYLHKFVQDICAKCDKEKRDGEAFAECLKCSGRYHKHCFGKNGAVCSNCQSTIDKQIRQTSLLEYFSPAKRSHKQCEILNMLGKQDDESTKTSTIHKCHFLNPFPKMSPEEVAVYQTDLMFAIKAKKMEHTEVLMPVNCSLDDDSEESLDFGILHMNNQEYLAYLVYKKQPYGPFRLQYRDNMGYDVIADKDIKERTIVCEYIGDVITFREAVLRHKVKGHNDSIMELKTGKNADETLVIWPQRYTNLARFLNGINNSDVKSEPNVESIRMLANGHPVVILYTLRNIKEGERLVYDYNAGGLNGYDTSQFVPV